MNDLQSESQKIQSNFAGDKTNFTKNVNEAYNYKK